jgi:hypothetical protein
MHQAEAEDSVLDLSTMNKNREEAANMKSFDEFEQWSDQQAANQENAAPTPAKKVTVNLHKEEETKDPKEK